MSNAPAENVDSCVWRHLIAFVCALQSCSTSLAKHESDEGDSDVANVIQSGLSKQYRACQVTES